MFQKRVSFGIKVIVIVWANVAYEKCDFLLSVLVSVSILVICLKVSTTFFICHIDRKKYATNLCPYM